MAPSLVLLIHEKYSERDGLVSVAPRFTSTESPATAEDAIRNNSTISQTNLFGMSTPVIDIIWQPEQGAILCYGA